MKETFALGLMAAMLFAVLGFAAWIGMNKTLCNRGYSAADYQEMELDCSQKYPL